VVRTFLRRKPRTRKDRLIAKLTAVRQRGIEAWARVRHPRRRHVVGRDIEELVMHVAKLVRGSETEQQAQRPRLARLHLPHRTG
jgi:hypothetical protein